ncbi:MAG TPA: L,D-transpeptidase family protein [Casimicrobiaceae bacterium]|nr:L,D-transpeptidase family protein [Casimicrobiaceae bacterium]
MRILFVLIAGLALQLGAATSLSQVKNGAERDALQTLITRGTLPELRRPNIARFHSALEEVYGEADYAPRWLSPGSSPRAMLAELADAPNYGLDAADYGLDWLEAELSAIQAGDRSPARMARLDVALTVSFFRFASDLHAGRVTPEQAGFKFSGGDKPLDLAALLRSGLATGHWHHVVTTVEPSLTLYRRLEVALARYRTLATASLSTIPALPAGKSKIQPGDRYAGVAAIAERLRLVGDLPATATLAGSDRYEGALVEAVRRFQERHGLQADGVLGRDTLAELAKPLAARLHQIELSLERLRWLPEVHAGPAIAVNIPSYRLWAFADAQDDAAAQLTMAVIVGRAVKARATPVFIGQMRYLDFSPYWNVPPPIQRAEIVPRLARDPGYWEREDFEAVSVDGKGAPITVLDDNTLQGLKSGALRVRQRPGAKNALGGVKFVLPNTMDIYLHSTSAQQLFSQTRRDFSHGCVRVEDPAALAAFVLRDQPAWTPERIHGAMAAGRQSTVMLTQPIPVLIFYTTAIVEVDGRVRFASDIYGLDAKLDEALRAR